MHSHKPRPNACSLFLKGEGDANDHFLRFHYQIPPGLTPPLSASFQSLKLEYVGNHRVQTWLRARLDRTEHDGVIAEWTVDRLLHLTPKFMIREFKEFAKTDLKTAFPHHVAKFELSHSATEGLFSFTLPPFTSVQVHNRDEDEEADGSWFSVLECLGFSENAYFNPVTDTLSNPTSSPVTITGNLLRVPPLLSVLTLATPMLTKRGKEMLEKEVLFLSAVEYEEEEDEPDEEELARQVAAKIQEFTESKFSLTFREMTNHQHRFEAEVAFPLQDVWDCKTPDEVLDLLRDRLKLLLPQLNVHEASLAVEFKPNTEQPATIRRNVKKPQNFSLELELETGLAQVLRARATSARINTQREADGGGGRIDFDLAAGLASPPTVDELFPMTVTVTGARANSYIKGVGMTGLAGHWEREKAPSCSQPVVLETGSGQLECRLLDEQGKPRVLEADVAAELIVKVKDTDPRNQAL